MNLPFQNSSGQPGSGCGVLAGAVLAVGALLHTAYAGASAPVDPSTPTAAVLDSGCVHTHAARQSLVRIAHELSSQGMALEATCQPGNPGWVVKVRVVDGTRAARAVRGPLADGHEVDMGTPAGVLAVQAQAQGVSGFSPDVQHNRQWLRTLMARHQFDNVPRAWWLFAERGAGNAAASAVASR